MKGKSGVEIWRLQSGAMRLATKVSRNIVGDFKKNIYDKADEEKNIMILNNKSYADDNCSLKKDDVFPCHQVFSLNSKNHVCNLNQFHEGIFHNFLSNP